MAGFARNIRVTALDGWLTCDVKLTTVAEKAETGLIQLCTGEGKHAPLPPCWDPTCEVCKSTVKKSTLVKGKKVGDTGYAVVTSDELDALDDDAQYKGRVELTFHDATEVDATIVPTGTSYYGGPKDNDPAWYRLREVLRAAPDIAALCLYTVTSRAALYRVKPYADVLMWEQVCRPEEIKATPEVQPFEAPAEIAEMGATLARASVKPYNAADYRNTYAEKVKEAVAAREVDAAATVVASAGAAAAPVDPMEAMKASFAAALAAKGIQTDSAASADDVQKPKRKPRKAAAAKPAPEAVAS